MIQRIYDSTSRYLNFPIVLLRFPFLMVKRSRAVTFPVPTQFMVNDVNSITFSLIVFMAYVWFFYRIQGCRNRNSYLLRKKQTFIKYSSSELIFKSVKFLNGIFFMTERNWILFTSLCNEWRMTVIEAFGK